MFSPKIGLLNWHSSTKNFFRKIRIIFDVKIITNLRQTTLFQNQKKKSGSYVLFSRILPGRVERKSMQFLIFRDEFLTNSVNLMKLFTSATLFKYAISSSKIVQQQLPIIKKMGINKVFEIFIVF